jgi:hypothetical protein
MLAGLRQGLGSAAAPGTLNQTARHSSSDDALSRPGAAPRPAGCRDYAPLLAVSAALRFWRRTGEGRIRQYQQELLQQVGAGRVPTFSSCAWHSGLGSLQDLAAGMSLAGGPWPAFSAPGWEGRQHATTQ